MINKNKLSINYIFNLLNRIIILIIPLITTPYLTRVLGTKELGLYNYANTIASYYLMAAMMGISMLGNREIALSKNIEERNRVISKLLSIQVFNTIICLTGYVIYVFFICKSEKMIFLIQILFISSAFFDVSWFLYGMERFKLVALRNIVVNIVTTFLIFILVKNKSDITVYTIIKCCSILMSQIVLLISCIKEIYWIKPDINEVTDAYKKLFILFIPVISESIFHNMDRLMLGSFINYSAVAIYYTSRMITDIPQCFVTSINTMIYPRISSLISLNKDIEAKKITYVSFELINAVCIGMAFGIIAIIKNFVEVYLGNEYQYCAVTISWLTPYIVLAAWNGTIRYQFLLPNSLEKVYSKAIVVGIVSNLIFNIILIKKFQIIGVILATVISELITAIIQSKAALKKMEILKHIRNAFFYSLVGMIMLGTISFVDKLIYYDLILKIIIEILIGLVIYTVLSIIIIVKIDKNIKKLFNGIKKYKNLK